MGAEISYLCRSVLPKPRSCTPERRASSNRFDETQQSYESKHRRQGAPIHHTIFDKETVVNTSKNRSPTSVGRHLALWRLARKLSSLGRIQRVRVIKLLKLSPLLLKQVRKYTLRNLFVPVSDDWKMNCAHRLQTTTQNGHRIHVYSSRDCPSIEFIAAQPDWLPVSRVSTTKHFKKHHRQNPPSPRKSVSFAQFTETRLYFD